jgi:hypothetical protein
MADCLPSNLADARRGLPERPAAPAAIPLVAGAAGPGRTTAGGAQERYPENEHREPSDDPGASVKACVGKGLARSRRRGVARAGPAASEVPPEFERRPRRADRREAHGPAGDHRRGTRDPQRRCRRRGLDGLGCPARRRRWGARRRRRRPPGWPAAWRARRPRTSSARRPAPCSPREQRLAPRCRHPAARAPPTIGSRALSRSNRLAVIVDPGLRSPWASTDRTATACNPS